MARKQEIQQRANRCSSWEWKCKRTVDPFFFPLLFPPTHFLSLSLSYVYSDEARKNVEFEKVKIDTCWSLFFSINKKFNFAIDEAETIDERKIARNLKKKKKVWSNIVAYQLLYAFQSLGSLAFKFFTHFVRTLRIFPSLFLS